MWAIIVTTIMGIVEGVTEFIPVSSTGHLIITGDLLKFSSLFHSSDQKMAADCFEVVIQLGAILAVVFLYWNRFAGLFNFKKTEGFYGFRGWVMLFLTSLPAAVMGVIVYKPMKHYLFQPIPVVIALAVGAIAILLVEKFKPQSDVKSLDDMKWHHALYVGFFQCFSLWPGMSRSASTIMGGMLSRMDRMVAAEYSFLAAVPIMFAATAKDLYETREALTKTDWPLFAIGFGVSFIVAVLAVQTFIKLLSRCTLRPFAYYRLAVAAIFAILAFTKIITVAK
jgi:undecaprenyl-diphosphatase